VAVGRVVAAAAHEGDRLLRTLDRSDQAGERRITLGQPPAAHRALAGVVVVGGGVDAVEHQHLRAVGGGERFGRHDVRVETLIDREPDAR